MFLLKWHYEHLFDDVLPELRSRGVTDAQINTMLVGKPRPALRRLTWLRVLRRLGAVPEGRSAARRDPRTTWLGLSCCSMCLRNVMAGPLLTLYPQQRGSHDVAMSAVCRAVDDLGYFASGSSGAVAQRRG